DGQLTKVRALLLGEPQGVIDAKINEICSDPNLTYDKLAALLYPSDVPVEYQPPSKIEVPDSIKRRLILNNQVSKIVPAEWGKLAKDFTNGIVPEGFDPYFPEERTALKMLGFSDEDLKMLPPAGKNLDDILDQYGNEQYENLKSGGHGMAGGYLFGVAMVFLYAAAGSFPIFL
ncbi:MAG: hypothetical protein AABY86_13740, partial [Bdellovibrionota bacterium]